MFLVRNPTGAAFFLKDDYVDIKFEPASGSIDLEVFFTHEQLYYSSLSPSGALWLAIQNGNLIRRDNSDAADVPALTAFYDAIWRYSPNEGQWEALVGTPGTPSSANRYLTELALGVPSTATTVDDQPVLLYTFAVPYNSNGMLSTNIVCSRTGGTSGVVGDGAQFVRIASVKNVQGFAQVKIVESAFSFSDQYGWKVFFAISGASVEIYVQGAIGNTVTWFGKTLAQMQSF